MAILDAELQMLLARKEHFDKNPSSGPLDVRPDEPLFIAVKFHGDVNALVAVGFHLGSAIGSIAFGQTTLAGLAALAQHPQVEFIEKQRRADLHLDVSVPETRANLVWTRVGDHFTGYSGRGVIVGIVDSGIDIRHHAFRKPDGTTRVLKIWDQTLTALTAEGAPGPITDPAIAATPMPLGYGVEYDANEINETLQSADPVVPVRHVDRLGHGTHVAGIAAGDGSQNGNCHGAYNYVGVATEADLMVVRMWGLTKGDPAQPATPNSVMVDAIAYLLNEAHRAGKPLAINLSLGKFSDKMDGTSAVCQAIDTLLTHNSQGRAIVFSAGNDGNNDFHATGVVPAGAGNVLRFDFTVFDGDTATRQLYVRCGGATPQIRVTSPVAGPIGVVGWVPFGPPGFDDFSANGVGGVVSIRSQAGVINITIQPPAPGRNVPGTWALELQSTGAAAAPVDAFCLFGSSHDPKSPRFTSATTSRSTLNEFATGFQTIAVGSYHESGLVFSGHLSDFSSRGPTLDAVARPHPKPELAAPGENITSAGLPRNRAGCHLFCCQCCQDFYVDMSGTSMSAPHVTGAIALMLHKNPTLRHADIRDLLAGNTAPKIPGSTPDEDQGWGRGRLDVKKVIDAVAQVNPPAAQLVAATPPLVELRDSLFRTERGAALYGLVEQYAAEVWALIQGNRRVATIWHRCKGPVWVRRFLLAVHAADTAMRLEVDGLHLRDSMLRFAGALKRFGSPALRHDVQAWESAIALIEDSMSLAAIVDAVGNRSVIAPTSPVPA